MAVRDGPELRAGRVHEVVAGMPGDAAARVFAARVAGCRGGTCLWIAERRIPLLCPHGLAGLADPGKVLCVLVETPLDGLWVAEEALRSGTVGTVVLESTRGLDLRQSRRLQLAAEEGGAVGLFLGPEGGNTAAETRWSCGALPGGGEGRSIRFDWRQVKNRCGRQVRLEAIRDEATGSMRVAAASGGGAGVEERAGPGPAPGYRERSERRLAALLAEHGGAGGGVEHGHGPR